MAANYTQQSGALTHQNWQLRPTHSELLFPRGQRNLALSKRQNAVRIAATYLLYPCMSCFRAPPSGGSQAPADFILFHPLLRRYVKHATLIEKCFPPEKLGETVPNSNELSYLVYYAQSKPAKLAKVGAYLAKRGKKDLQRRRRGDVLVGLRIFDALLEECGRDLNFFGKEVLGALDGALHEGDAEVAWAAVRTFELFCRCHTGATLAIDTELRAMYTGMVRMLVASKGALGMRAIQAVVESQATYASDRYDELPQIAQALLDRLASAPDIEPAEDAQALTTQIQEIHQDKQPDRQVLGQWAWECMAALVRRSHGQHSQVVTGEVFKYLDTRLMWQPAEFCVRLVECIIGNLQAQDQNMVIVETLAFLTDGTRASQRCLDSIAQAGAHALERIDTQAPGTSHDAAGEVRRATIVRVLESLFCRPYILVGISVMEVLNILVTFLLEVLGESRDEPDLELFGKTLQDSDSTEHLPTYYHLLAAIGGLAKHQYYSDQLADMVGYLVKQMQLEASDGMRQAWLLQALYLVLANSRTDSSGRIPMVVPLSVYVPLFTLLSREPRAVRSLAADCIIGLLRHDRAVAGGFALRSSAATAAWSNELATAIRQKLIDGLEQAGTAEHAAAASIMCELLATHTPMAEQLVLETLQQSNGQSAGSVSMRAMVWQRIASERRASDLSAYIARVVVEAKEKQCWSTPIEHACEGHVRIVAIIDDCSCSDESLLQKLMYPELSSYLSLSLPELTPSTSQQADQVLLNHQSSATPELARKAVERVNDMRARISIDWETQAKRDSLAPHVNMDQLRAALRTGLNMRSAEFSEDLENNADLDDDIGTTARSLRVASHDHSSSPNDVPDEVRALLESLDEPAGSPYEHRRDCQTSSSISTPIVSHVD